MASNPQLEQAIESNPDDKTAYSVYADWLQSQGDPRGELVALSLAGGDTTAAQAKVLGPLAEYAKTFDGNDGDTFTWKNGFIDSAFLSHNTYSKPQGDLTKGLQLLLDHPAARFLRELRFAFNNDPNEDNCQSLIDVLAAQPRPTIKSLFFGDIKYAGAARDEDQGEDTEISWYSVGNLSELWKSVPNLEKLIVTSGSAESAMAGGTQLGELNLPKLKHLEFRTGGLEKSNFDAIVASQTPALEHLDVWIGREDYGCSVGTDEIANLVSRQDIPKLKHLGIMNCEFVDEIVGLLTESTLVRGLRELDLSLGCLTDDGVEQLTSDDLAWSLDKLDVSRNLLTDASALDGVAKTVIADDQRDADSHYAAVGE
ncbi:MAG: TIGR02996 domain-containing protein [Kofleriaceae bacterium]